MLLMMRRVRVATGVALVSMMCMRAELDRGLKYSNTAYTVDFVTQMGVLALTHHLIDSHIAPCTQQWIKNAFKEPCDDAQKKIDNIGEDDDEKSMAESHLKLLKSGEDFCLRASSALSSIALQHGLSWVRRRMLSEFYPDYFPPSYFKDKNRPWVVAMYVTDYIPLSLQNNTYAAFAGGLGVSAAFIVVNSYVYRQYNRAQEGTQKKMFLKLVSTAGRVVDGTNISYHTTTRKQELVIHTWRHAVEKLNNIVVSSSKEMSGRQDGQPVIVPLVTE